MNWQEELRAARAATGRAIRQREAELRRFASNAEARGRQVYEKAIKTGERVLARTPAEIRALGIAAAQGRLPQALGEAAGKAVAKVVAERVAPPRDSKPSPSATPRKSIVDKALDEVGAAARGAIDEATFGLSDRGSAAVQALAKGGVDDFGEHYTVELAEEREADAYDEQHHGLARNAGRVAGFVGSLALTGGTGALAKAGARVVGIAPSAIRAANSTKRAVELSRDGLTPIAIVGGSAAGLTGQATSDLLTGHRSNLQDYAGAALGGATGALLLRAPRIGNGPAAEVVHRVLVDPRVAGGVEGAATEAYQGAFNGREASLNEIGQAARGGAIGASLGDVVGKYGSNSLSRKTKGQLGEGLSVVKAVMAGDGVPFGVARPEFNLPVAGPGRQVAIDLDGGGQTIADHITSKGIIGEAKFGASARLSNAQKRARRQFGTERYKVDHWLPSDMGRAAALGFGAPAGDMYRTEYE